MSTVLTVRNGFIEAVDLQELHTAQSLRRSSSDSSLSHTTSSCSSTLWVHALQPLNSSQSQSRDSERSEQQSGVDRLQELREEDGTGSRGLAAEHPSELVLMVHEETGVPIQTLVELDVSGTLAQIPRNDNGWIGSLGSIEKHYDGTCSPCIFWFRGDCANNILCQWCHFRHAGQKSKRYKPNKRTREARKAAKDQEQAYAEEEEKDTELFPAGSSRSSPWPATAVMENPVQIISSGGHATGASSSLRPAMAVTHQLQ